MNNTKYIPMFLTEILLLFIFRPLLFVFLYPQPPSVYMYIYAAYLYICPFISKYFSMYLPRIRTFSYLTQIQLSTSGHLTLNTLIFDYYFSFSNWTNNVLYSISPPQRIQSKITCSICSLFESGRVSQPFTDFDHSVIFEIFSLTPPF